MESFKESWRVLKPFLVELLTKLGAQTGLYSHRRWLKALKFMKKRYCKKCENSQGLSSCSGYFVSDLLSPFFCTCINFLVLEYILKVLLNDFARKVLEVMMADIMYMLFSQIVVVY